MDYDLIVVGAGPAGCTAAARAAAHGMRVALIEMRSLPRHKPCGGATPALAISAIDTPEAARCVECRADTMRHTFAFAEAITARFAGPSAQDPKIICTFRRDAFDNALAAGAARCGADLIDRVTVEGVVSDRRGVRLLARSEVHTSEFAFTAPYVIGADGVTGAVARSIGLQSPHRPAIAIQTEVPHQWQHGHELLRPNVLHIEHGAVRGGYAWVFPKADHLNIGAGLLHAFRSDEPGDALMPELVRVLTAYLTSLGVEPTPDGFRVRGHPLPLWSGRRRLQDRHGRVLLTGDAACLANPLFGDGIANALTSGRIAAECVLEGVSGEYTRRLHARLAPGLDAARRLAAVFYAHPGLCYRYGVRRPGATAIAARLLCNDENFRTLVRRALRRLAVAARA